jgi:hypothetical protein
MLMAASNVVDDDANLVIRFGHCRMILDKGDDGRLEACFLDENSMVPVCMADMYPETTERGGCGHASSILPKPARWEKGINHWNLKGAMRRRRVFASPERCGDDDG